MIEQTAVVATDYSRSNSTFTAHPINQSLPVCITTNTAAYSQ